VPPSQLISRRPPEIGPGLLPLFGLPRAARKASTVAWIDAVVASPPTDVGVNPASTGVAKTTTKAKLQAIAAQRGARSKIADIRASMSPCPLARTRRATK